jgi:quercetin dioxygenase-like cupin family protein
MKIVRFDRAESYEPEKDWKRVSLCCEDNISIEHFVKPAGHASPEHQHPSAQVLLVLKGRLAVITDADGEQELGEGDAAYIPGNESHVVKNPLGEACIGIDIFVPGRSFDFWLRRKRDQSTDTHEAGKTE